MLLTTQVCARLRTGPIIMQIPRGYQKIKFIVQKGAICAILGEKIPFLASQEAKKVVCNYAKARKAAHWPNNNAKSLGAIRKKVYCAEWRICAILRASHGLPRDSNKLLLTTQGCARLRTGPIIMQIPRGYQKKKFIV